MKEIKIIDEYPYEKYILLKKYYDSFDEEEVLKKYEKVHLTILRLRRQEFGGNKGVHKLKEDVC